MRAKALRITAAAAVAALTLTQAVVLTQDRLKTMPGYDQYQRILREIPGAVKSGALTVTWADDGRAFEYTRDGRRYRFDVSTRREEAATAATPGRGGRGGGDGSGGQPARGRPVEGALSP